MGAAAHHPSLARYRHGHEGHLYPVSAGREGALRVSVLMCVHLLQDLLR